MSAESSKRLCKITSLLNCQKYNFVVHISELIRREALQEGQPNKYCRVMAYNETHGMLVVSQVRETDVWKKTRDFLS